MQLLVMFGIIWAIVLVIGLFISLCWAIKTIYNNMVKPKKKDELGISEVAGGIVILFMIGLAAYGIGEVAQEIINKHDDKIESEQTKLVEELERKNEKLERKNEELNILNSNTCFIYNEKIRELEERIKSLTDLKVWENQSDTIIYREKPEKSCNKLITDPDLSTIQWVKEEESCNKKIINLNLSLTPKYEIDEIVLTQEGPSDVEVNVHYDEQPESKKCEPQN